MTPVLFNFLFYLVAGMVFTAFGMTPERIGYIILASIIYGSIYKKIGKLGKAFVVYVIYLLLTVGAARLGGWLVNLFVNH